jgi:hypothetical protein
MSHRGKVARAIAVRTEPRFIEIKENERAGQNVCFEINCGFKSDKRECPLGATCGRCASALLEDSEPQQRRSFEGTHSGDDEDLTPPTRLI